MGHAEWTHKKAFPEIHKYAFPDLIFFQSITAPNPRVRVADPGDRNWKGAPPLFAARCGHGGVAQFTFAQHALGGRSRPIDPRGKA